jgi:hypothetical protein
MLARPGETRSDQPRDFGSAQTSTASRVTQRFVLGVLPPPEREAGGRVVHTTRDEPAEGFRPDRVPRAGLGQLPRSRGASPARLRLRRDALSAVGCGLRIVRKRRAPGTGSSSVVPAGRASARYGARDRHFGGERVRNGACSARRSPRATWANARGATAVGDGISGRGEWTSKRNEAQEGAGRPAPATVADFTRLDDGARPRSRRSRSSHRDGPGNWRRCRVKRGDDRAGNGRGARGAVTRYGCRRGFLRGVRTCIAGKQRWSRSFDRGASSGNAVDPRIGSGMQQARDSWSGGSRRGGEKPRGRNGTSRVAPSRPKRRPAVVAGVDASRARRWRGDRRTTRSRVRVVRTKPREKVEESTRAIGRLRRGAKVRRFARTVPSGNAGRTGSGTLEGQPGDGQGRGGRGEDQRPTAHPGRATPRTSKDQRGVTDLEHQ